ncbi:MAG: hypothetical protein SFZ23_14975 [Planctomycetota bacterium]|nr:hypothetical protein [Planctomycetota bacterium]
MEHEQASDGTGPRSEQIIGPQEQGMLRDAKRVGNAVVAVGMGRQAYLRGAIGEWRRIDQEILDPGGDVLNITGFNAVAGRNADDLHACGFRGEIWHWDGRRWKQEDSPTNVILHAMEIAADGTRFAAGQLGVLMRWRDNSWEVIQHESVSDDIWSLVWYNGRLFGTTEHSIFVLDPDDTLSTVWEGPAGSCLHLSAGRGALWSFGQTRAAWTVDVLTWTEAPLP